MPLRRSSLASALRTGSKRTAADYAKATDGSNRTANAGRRSVPDLEA